MSIYIIYDNIIYYIYNLIYTICIYIYIIYYNIYYTIYIIYNYTINQISKKMEMIGVVNLAIS